ncbi:MAG: c-type cytochrome [Aquificaceae bacterium]|nr:c-type cytochrome [Aquificaceae bacterium]
MKAGIFLLFMALGSLSFGGGAELYRQHCSSCHGEDRLGRVAPPLFSFPPFFTLKSDEKIYRVIKEGATGMPAFNGLKDEEIKAIIEFIKKPIEREKLKWDEKRVKESSHLVELDRVDFKNLKGYTLLVERGKNLIWVMEDQKILLKFPFSNMHGGIKFSTSGSAYIPSRDGWIGKYSPAEGKLKRIRACIYLRNIALSPQGDYLAASCWIPSDLLLFDSDLNLLRRFEVHGRINAVYELNSINSFVFTLRDKPLVGFINIKDLSLNYKSIDTVLEDFTIDPLEEYLIGGTKEGLRVYSIKDLSPIKKLKTEGLPHLASAYFWYSKGSFYFATPLPKKSTLSIWKAYEWEHVKDVPTGGEGFLARSHYASPYVWVDTSSDKILLLDKRSLEVKELIPSKGKRATHTEFSGDGKVAYVSVYEKEGALVLFDGVSLRKLGEHSASLPAGKYNFINKSRRFDPAQLGYQVFMERCWGCHHTTREAFGPPLKWSLQKRGTALVVAQILDPEKTHRLLGYSRSAMPRIELRKEELLALVRFMEALKDDWMD